MRAVAESIRKNDGFVKQELWENIGVTWDEFYADIPINIKMKGLEMLEEFKINYEWVRPGKADLKEAGLEGRIRQAHDRRAKRGACGECISPGC